MKQSIWRIHADSISCNRVIHSSRVIFLRAIPCTWRVKQRTQHRTNTNWKNSALNSRAAQFWYVSNHVWAPWLTWCLFTEQKDGFWTYELCPFKGVRQFHQDENSDSSTEFSLGTYIDHYLSSPDSGSSPRTYVQVTLKLVHSLFIWYHSYFCQLQNFEAGTDGRKSKAVFQCAEPGRSIGLSAVKEDPIHSYTLTVLSPQACGITSSPAALIGSTAVRWQDQCVRQVQRWWTLEVCPGHNVRQYHKEDDGSITEVVLGKFDASKSKLQQAEPDTNPKVRHAGLNKNNDIGRGIVRTLHIDHRHRPCFVSRRWARTSCTMPRSLRAATSAPRRAQRDQPSCATFAS